MQAITLKDAKRNLTRLMDKVLADAEPCIVVNDQGGQVVVMPLDEFSPDYSPLSFVYASCGARVGMSRQ